MCLGLPNCPEGQKRVGKSYFFFAQTFIQCSFSVRIFFQLTINVMLYFQPCIQLAYSCDKITPIMHAPVVYVWFFALFFSNIMIISIEKIIGFKNMHIWGFVIERLHLFFKNRCKHLMSFNCWCFLWDGNKKLCKPSFHAPIPLKILRKANKTLAKFTRCSLSGNIRWALLFCNILCADFILLCFFSSIFD